MEGQEDGGTHGRQDVHPAKSPSRQNRYCRQPHLRQRSSSWCRQCIRQNHRCCSKGLVWQGVSPGPVPAIPHIYRDANSKRAAARPSLSIRILHSMTEIFGCRSDYIKLSSEHLGQFQCFLHGLLVLSLALAQAFECYLVPHIKLLVLEQQRFFECIQLGLQLNLLVSHLVGIGTVGFGRESGGRRQLECLDGGQRQVGQRGV